MIFSAASENKWSDAFHLSANRTWTDLTLGRKGPRSPTKTNKRVLVIGGSVTGLTTAWLLLDYGYDVTIVSDRYAPGDPPVTGQIAGALWEYPPAVCGQHTDDSSLEKSRVWCQTSRNIFSDLVKNYPKGGHGVVLQMANFFFTAPLTDPSMTLQWKKMNEIEKLNLPDFLHDRDQIMARNHIRDDVNLAKEPNAEPRTIKDAYRHESPVIDTDAYLVWLKNLVEDKGAKTVQLQKPLEGRLIDQELELLKTYEADAILNATGLGSRTLADDESVRPVRGCLLHVKNGVGFPRVTEVLAVSNTDANTLDDIVFIVPRNDNTLLLGGSVEEDKWELDLTIDCDLVKKMRERCEQFLPGLKNAVPNDIPFVQGLRPFRRGKEVRVEADGGIVPNSNGKTSRIVHAYGHGGSGFTLSFGSAMAAFAALEHNVLRVRNYVEEPIDGKLAYATDQKADYEKIESLRKGLEGLGRDLVAERQNPGSLRTSAGKILEPMIPKSLLMSI